MFDDQPKILRYLFYFAVIFGTLLVVAFPVVVFGKDILPIETGAWAIIFFYFSMKKKRKK